jgi:hypothetical protein
MTRRLAWFDEAIHVIAEWGYDAFSPRDVIRGKHDTMVDLVLDALGALAAAFLVRGMTLARGKA